MFGFKHAPWAFAGSAAAIMVAIGPHQAQQSWLRDVRDGNGAETSANVGLSSGAGEVAGLFAAHARPTLQPLTKSRADPFRYKGTAINRARAAECLAAAAWYEVGDDPVGQRAVIQTVINRVNNAHFPNSFCGVVFEGSDLPTGCQFTFTCDGSLKRRHPSVAAWKRALSLSQAALDGFVDQNVGTATHYHASYVNPWWSAKLERITSVGSHIFYRWAGGEGRVRGQRTLAAERDYDALVQESIAREANVKSLGAQQGARPFAENVSSNSAPAAAGAKVPTGSAIFLPLQPGEASGRWALTAMKACKGRSDCQVLGYSGADQIMRNQVRSAKERDRPTFLFIRDAASGMAVALWDCQKIDRPAKSECLPADGMALANLMRERS